MADEQQTEMVEQEATEDGAEMAGQADGEMPEANEDAGQELEQLRAALKKANKDAERNRRKLAEFEQAEQDRRDAELSETERLKKQLAEAKAQQEALVASMKEAQVRSAVERTAAQMRFHDPADAYALADLSAVTVDEDGKIDGVEDVLKKLAKAKPHLVRTEQPVNTNASSRTNGASGMTDDQAQELAAIYGVRPENIKKASIR